MTWHTIGCKVDENTLQDINKFLEDFKKEKRANITLSKFVLMCINTCKKHYYSKKESRNA